MSDTEDESRALLDFYETLRERQPRNDTGLYLYTHQHEWIEVGAERWPNGEWSPVFRCLICTDVISTDAVQRPRPVLVTWNDHGGERHQSEMDPADVQAFSDQLASSHSIIVRVEPIQ